MISYRYASPRGPDTQNRFIKGYDLAQILSSEGKARVSEEKAARCASTDPVRQKRSAQVVKMVFMALVLVIRFSKSDSKQMIIEVYPFPGILVI